MSPCTACSQRKLSLLPSGSGVSPQSSQSFLACSRVVASLCFSYSCLPVYPSTCVGMCYIIVLTSAWILQSHYNPSTTSTWTMHEINASSLLRRQRTCQTLTCSIYLLCSSLCLFWWLPCELSFDVHCNPASFNDSDAQFFIRVLGYWSLRDCSWTCTIHSTLVVTVCHARLIILILLQHGADA